MQRDAQFVGQMRWRMNWKISYLFYFVQYISVCLSEARMPATEAAISCLSVMRRQSAIDYEKSQ